MITIKSAATTIEGETINIEDPIVAYIYHQFIKAALDLREEEIRNKIDDMMSSNTTPEDPFAFLNEGHKLWSPEVDQYEHELRTALIERGYLQELAADGSWVEKTPSVSAVTSKLSSDLVFNADHDGAIVSNSMVTVQIDDDILAMTYLATAFAAKHAGRLEFEPGIETQLWSSWCTKQNINPNIFPRYMPELIVNRADENRQACW